MIIINKFKYLNNLRILSMQSPLDNRKDNDTSQRSNKNNN